MENRTEPWVVLGRAANKACYIKGRTAQVSQRGAVPHGDGPACVDDLQITRIKHSQALAHDDTDVSRG
jgi:hypothetical protein